MPDTAEMTQLPDLDTYLQLIGFSYIKKSSMCQGKKTTLIYQREKPNKMTIQLILDKESFLEGVTLQPEHIKEGAF